MATLNWQLSTPINAVVFDCDGTLSTIEGIDELAKINGAGKEVESITAEAMGKTGINPAIYQKRLDLVRPTLQQVQDLGETYFIHCTPDAGEVIQTLQRLKKSIYLVSAGLSPAVIFFGEALQIPIENVFAVNIQFDKKGNYVDFDRSSPCTDRDGKRIIISDLKTKYKRIIYIGDGLNDLAVQDLVTRFVGFGGTYYRENIAARCQYYIKALSMAPLLPLSLTKEEVKELTPAEASLYDKGLKLITA